LFDSIRLIDSSEDSNERGAGLGIVVQSQLCMPSLPSARKKMQVGTVSGHTKRSLARAFAQFTRAADSLEKSYGQLQAEVLRLRFELEETNRDLARSLEENARMRAYLGRILQELPCGVLVANAEGRVRMANAEAYRLLGVGDAGSDTNSGAAELAERTLSEQLSARGFAEVGAENLAGEIEWEFATAQGRRLVGVSCAVLSDGAGRSTEWAFLLRDITEERRAAAERETARRRDSLAQMAAVLAHEIRNPLGSLELFAGLLADAASEQPDLRRWTDHIQAGLRQLSATVNNVLQFHSQGPADLQAVNLGVLLREAVEFLRPLARQGGLRIDLVNGIGEVTIAADPHRLRQVVFNLALNAFRAMSKGGIFTIRLDWAAEEQGRAVQLEFVDDGCGMPPETVAQILETAAIPCAANLGLGLAVCRGVVEQHGGTLRLASVLKKGTTFSVVLPCGGGEA